MIKTKSLPTARKTDVESLSSLATASSTNTRLLYRNTLYLIIGFLIGIYSTAVWLNTQPQCYTLSRNPITPENSIPSTLTPINTSISKTTNESLDQTSPDSLDNVLATDFDNATDIVEYLYNTTRVLCWIMTNPTNHLTKAIHIRNTWGRRCNKLLFISSQEDEQLHTIALPVREGRDFLWDKTKLALKYIYDHHLDDADWFLKADDDT